MARDISAALADVPNIAVVSSLGQLVAMGRIRAVFVRVGPTGENDSLNPLRAFMRHHPWTTVVPVICNDTDQSLLVSLGGLDVSDVLVWTPDKERGPWRRQVFRALCTGEADLVRRRTGGADVVVREALSWSIAHAERAPRVQELCDAMCMTRRVLYRHLRQKADLSPVKVLVAGRLIQAGLRLQCTDHSVEKAAMEVGFAEASGLRRALTRFVEGPPSAMREPGFLERILDALKLVPGEAGRDHASLGELH